MKVNTPPVQPRGASADQALALLRTDPKAAVSTYVYISKASSLSPTGAECKVMCTKSDLDENVFYLNQEMGKGDWFFPYVPFGSGGVGSCVVPLHQYLGSIALTGDMNGCALQVNRYENKHYFYHDANGKAIAANMTGEMAPRGEIVCRVTYEDMAGEAQEWQTPEGTVQGPLEKFLVVKSKHEGCVAVFRHTILTVRHDTKWVVVRSSSLESVKQNNDKSITRFFSKFSPTVNPQLAEFDAGIT